MSFDAGTIQQFSMAAQGVGAIAGAVGSIQAGRAQAQAAQYQAAVARNNKTIAEQNAQYALESGRAQEQTQRMKTAQIIGMQRAQMAANGIDIGSGMPLNIQVSTAQVGELDAQTIRNNAARLAYNYDLQALDFGANAQMLDATAKNARTSGAIGAFSSIVGGASGISDKWLKWKTPTSMGKG